MLSGALYRHLRVLRGPLHDDIGEKFGVAYTGHLADGEAPSAGSETTEVGSFKLDALPELAFASHRRAIADWKTRHPPADGPNSGAD